MESKTKFQLFGKERQKDEMFEPASILKFFYSSSEIMFKTEGFQTPSLPSFFQGQEREDFLEEALEPEGYSIRNEENDEETFFVEPEDSSSQFSLQMESMFKNVLEDEGTINERENEPSIQLQGNSVDKFFNNITQAQAISDPPKGALSVEELEARLNKNPEPPTNTTVNNNDNNAISSSPISHEQTFLARSPRTPNSHYRVWKEDKKRMTASEIEFVIRTQEFQMYTGNPFVDDYYFQTTKAQKTNNLKPLHKPLFESFSSNRFPPIKKPDPFEGVLGRIPSHSVRAPRPLLQLKSEETEGTSAAIDNSVSLSSRSTYSLLLTFENSFNYLLDIEDLTELIQRPESSNHFNLNFLYQKRDQLTNDLFHSLHVHILSFGTLPHKKVSRDSPFVFPQDETFIQFMFVHKGRQILARSIPLLFRDHLVYISFQFMRNLALIVGSPKLDSESVITAKIFGYLISFADALPAPQVILALQNIIAAHTVGYLIKILESKYGLALLQTLLKRAYDLGLSPFSKEISIPSASQSLAQFSSHWKETVTALFQMLQGNFSTLVGLINSPVVWEFLAVLLVHLNSAQKNQMLAELRSFFVSNPLEPTIAAFLHLCQQI